MVLLRVRSRKFSLVAIEQQHLPVVDVARGYAATAAHLGSISRPSWRCARALRETRELDDHRPHRGGAWEAWCSCEYEAASSRWSQLNSSISRWLTSPEDTLPRPRTWGLFRAPVGGVPEH